MFAFIQGSIYLVLAIAAFAFEGWALIDALRHTSGAYVAAGKQTKALWGGILGLAATIGFLALPYPLGAARVGALGILASRRSSPRACTPRTFDPRCAPSDPSRGDAATTEAAGRSACAPSSNAPRARR